MVAPNDGVWAGDSENGDAGCEVWATKWAGNAEIGGVTAWTDWASGVAPADGSGVPGVDWPAGISGGAAYMTVEEYNNFPT